METPYVIELPRRLESVGRDTFMGVVALQQSATSNVLPFRRREQQTPPPDPNTSGALGAIAVRDPARFVAKAVRS